MFERNDTSGQGGIKATEAQSREIPFIGKAKRGDYAPGARVQTFDRRPAKKPAQTFAFSGRGFLPNLFASHALVTLPEASATTLGNEGVYGREGMMPAPGTLAKLQAGQKLDEGSGGAGSFCTATAFNSKTNG